MPARNLPPLTTVHNANSRAVPGNCESKGSREPSNVTHFYENELIAAYRKPRESNRTTAASVPGSLHPVHLPAVQTSSASSKRGRTDNSGGAGDGPVQASSAHTAVEQSARQLSAYERREIFNYPHVYFVGPSAIKRCGVSGAPNNDGYDDDNGAYIQVYCA